MLKGKSDVLFAIIDTFKSSCFKHLEILCKCKHVVQKQKNKNKRMNQ